MRRALLTILGIVLARVGIGGHSASTAGKA